MARIPSLVTLRAGRHRFSCGVCIGSRFFKREIKLNTTGAEMFNLGWANKSAIGLVCERCGYLHTFVDGSVDLWDPDQGYPEEDPAKWETSAS